MKKSLEFKRELASHIIYKVGKDFGLTLYQMKDKEKTNQKVYAKATALYVIARFTKIDAVQLGEMFNRHRTDIYHYMRERKSYMMIDSVKTVYEKNFKYFSDKLKNPSSKFNAHGRNKLAKLSVRMFRKRQKGLPEWYKRNAYRTSNRVRKAKNRVPVHKKVQNVSISGTS
jgi:hypothetical protein